jgi:hypothetical protein
LNWTGWREAFGAAVEQRHAADGPTSGYVTCLLWTENNTEILGSIQVTQNSQAAVLAFPCTHFYNRLVSFLLQLKTIITRWTACKSLQLLQLQSEHPHSIRMYRSGIELKCRAHTVRSVRGQVNKSYCICISLKNPFRGDLLWAR